MNTFTYENIYSVLRAKGYTVESFKNLPKWKGRTLVSLTPEQAKTLIEHDGLVLKDVITRATPIKADSYIKDGTWTPEMGEVYLRPNYKVWKGMRILNAIASLDHPIDVYINVLDKGVFGTGTDTNVICTAIKNAIKDILEENGKDLPYLDDNIWFNSLPNKLTGLDITLQDSEPSLEEVIIEPPTIIGVLAEYRITDYPDMLYILRGNNQSGEAEAYSCNLIPALTRYEYPVSLRPDIYRELFAPASDFIGLIQANPAFLCTPQLLNKKIISYDPTPYQYMRISIPVQEATNGILPVGAMFKDDSIQEKFLDSLDIKNIGKNVTYILLEETDFGV